MAQKGPFKAAGMNVSELHLTLNAIGRLLLWGDVTRVANYYECPLPVYLGDHLVLFHSHRKLAETLSVLHAAARQGGVRRITPGFLRVEDSTTRRCLALVRWDHVLADGTVQSSSTVRYVFRRGGPGGRSTVEMVEYIELGLARFEDMLLPVMAR